MIITLCLSVVFSNAANHRRQKAGRGTSGAFCRPSVFVLCTPGTGVNLWGERPLYVSSVNICFVNTSISRRQGRNREGLSEESWRAKLWADELPWGRSGLWPWIASQNYQFWRNMGWKRAAKRSINFQFFHIKTPEPAISGIKCSHCGHDLKFIRFVKPEPRGKPG